MYRRGVLLLFGLTTMTATAMAQHVEPIRPLAAPQALHQLPPVGGQSPQVAPQTTPVLAPPLPAAVELTDIDRQLLKLKAQREALTSDQDSAKQQFAAGVNLEGTETAKLRAQLNQLILRLGGTEQKKAGNPPLFSANPPLPLPPIDTGKKSEPILPKQALDHKPSAEASVPKSADSHIPSSAPSGDPLALGHVLYKVSNWELALKAYRLALLSATRADEKAPIQYLMGACLRKMGKAEEAAALFREVANIRGDEQVAACAQWQLVQIRWQTEAEAQLKDIRERRKTLEAGK